MSQGDLGGAMFVIVAGRVGVRFVDPDGREQEVARLGPGDIVGEMSLFTGDRRTATVTALDNVDALKISKWSLERVFAKAPDLIDTFATFLARRQAQLDAVSRRHPLEEGFVRQARKAFASLFGA
jgi:CRP-like cAMP-binding protein